MIRFALSLVLCSVALLLALRAEPIAQVLGTQVSALILVVLTAAPLLLPRLIPVLRSAPLRGSDARRVLHKCIALSLGCLAVLVYASLVGHLGFGTFSAFTSLAVLALPLAVLALPLYVHWADQRLPDAEDGYLRLGQCLSGLRPWRWSEHSLLIRTWCVKVFFIPIMAGGLIEVSTTLVEMSRQDKPGQLIELMFYYGLFADLLVGNIGYFFASKLLGNNIKSVDTTWSGWLVCIICYVPLNGLLHLATAQRDHFIWSDWLTPDHWLYWPWAAVLATTWIVYWLSTTCFGIDFSNMTWRRLVDNGPYRYTKHPAFISKNLYWWMSTVPFFGVASGWDVCRNILGMSILSFAYYLRAKTEERHLMRFPEYAAYARRVDAHGWFAWRRRTSN